SLMAVELKNLLDTQLGVSVSSTAVFEFPTIQGLAAHLVEIAGTSLETIAPATVPEGAPEKVPEKVPEKAPEAICEPSPNASSLEQSDEQSGAATPDLSFDIAAELVALETLLDRT
ncbi:MAG: acyl carrier protein, partial [Cyanobacteria bacterium P01_A01_bin.105]